MSYMEEDGKTLACSRFQKQTVGQLYCAHGFAGGEFNRSDSARKWTGPPWSLKRLHHEQQDAIVANHAGCKAHGGTACYLSPALHQRCRWHRRSGGPRAGAKWRTVLNETRPIWFEPSIGSH